MVHERLYGPGEFNDLEARLKKLNDPVYILSILRMNLPTATIESLEMECEQKKEYILDRLALGDTMIFIVKHDEASALNISRTIGAITGKYVGRLEYEREVHKNQMILYSHIYRSAKLAEESKTHKLYDLKKDAIESKL